MPRLRWAFWAAVLLVVAAAGTGLLLTGTKHGTGITSVPMPAGADAVWPAGRTRAPAFALHDQAGKLVSLASYRGRPAIVTFIDPLCRDFCPLEARVLADAMRALEPSRRPAILAVSTNVYGNARAHLLEDIRKWQVGPDWRWAVGDEAELAPVWKGYHVAVIVRTKTVAGVRVHQVAHTEAAYLVDGAGDERALFIWPFRASAVRSAVESLNR